MPLIINSLGGRHTQAYSHCGQKQFQETSHTLAKGQCVTSCLYVVIDFHQFSQGEQINTSSVKTLSQSVHF